jgi:transposase
MSRYDLTDFEWSVIQPLLPNKPRGVPRVDDRRVLNGMFWVLRSGAPWADLPERYGPRTTVYNRFNRWRKAGVWDLPPTSSPCSNWLASVYGCALMSPRPRPFWS